MNEDKIAVRDFWDKASCGEALYLSAPDKDAYQKQAELRYALEPSILDFAEFSKYKGRRVLEIGVGLGADHQRFAEAGAILSGVDLTQCAIDHTRRRFQILGLNSELQVADAEYLPFGGDSFDLVYSWGVLHHTPDTEKAISEVFRVLKPGGMAKIMIYHKYSFVGLMLWLRYALFRLKPMTSLSQIYSQYLESPGTKAYSIAEARELFEKFRDVEITTVLTHGDLLTSSAGQRHQGPLLSVARLVWPGWLIRTFFPKYGLFILITVIK
jgi:ubiquinone/menaquinone biosynthesis C-methylase UbiE